MAADTMSRETLQMNLSTQSLDVQMQDPVDNTADNIRVYVRVRPPTEREQVVAAPPILSIDKATSSVLLRGDQSRTFAFDGVLTEEASQEDAFDLVGRRISSCCLAGYNGSVYVYGQTGVGKTYTLFGPISSVQSMHVDERRGLICRILDHVFQEINRRQQAQAEGAEGVSYLCRCSFLEIYKEQITDLLEVGNSNLQVREDMHHGVYVERLSEPTVWSLTEAFQVLWKGLQQRHVGATQMNERSSRSHAVFTLSVEVAHTRAGVTSTRIARLSLVDLAGSERQPGTLDQQGLAAPYQSVRVKEAAAINRSLSALTNVIMSLSRAATSRRRSSGDGRRPYVHYRDSKLTFLLRDSLGGNSKTVIVANISPSALCFSETLSTLKFAARAKHIRCTAVRNEEYSGTVESLMQEVKLLRGRLAQLSCRDCTSRAQLTLSESALELGKGLAAAAGVAAGGGDDSVAPEDDESQVLYSRKRVRRLEVLLAAGLERERLADHRRHQLHRLAGFLEDLDFRKSQHMVNLHKDYAELTKQIERATVAGDESAAAELTTKLTGFSPLLGNLVASRGREKLSDHAMEAKADFQSAAGVAGAAAPGARSRKRGTSQSLQKGASDSMSPTSKASRGGPDLQLLSSAAGFPGALADEANFLRQENQRLQQQLEGHPEVARLAAENKILRQQLAEIDSLGADRDRTKAPSKGEQAWSSASRPKAAKSEKREPSLTNTLRSVFTGMFSGSRGGPKENAVVRSPSSSSDEGVKNSRLTSPSSLGSPQQNLSGLSVTAEMMQRIADVDEDSTLRAWVHFQKMAKEVEELIRAKENLSGMAKQMRSHDGLWATLGSKGESIQRTPSFKNCVEPSIIEELVHNTQDALGLGQTIIDSREGASEPPTISKEFQLFDESSEDSAPGSSLSSGWAQHRHRHSSSSLQGSPSSRGSSAGFRARSGSRLLSVSEQEDSPRASRYPLSGLHNTPAAVAASAASLRLPSPRSEPADKVEVRQALQRVKQLHGTVDLVSSTYNDAYDQFQRLREEYESRLEECQFFELQCSRLDLQCHNLVEQLDGSGGSPSVRTGMGSFSATGLAAPGSLSQQRRSFSLSSLRDVNFWEQRFQELSQLTGIDEAGRGDPNRRQQLSVSGKASSVPSSGSPDRTISPERKLATGRAAAARPVRHTGTSPVVLQSSVSLSSLHGEDGAPPRGSSTKTSSREAAVVRRVASAPLLPTFNDPRVVTSRSPAVYSTRSAAASVPVPAPSDKTSSAPSVSMQPRPQLEGIATVGSVSELSELRNVTVGNTNFLSRHPGSENRQPPLQFAHPQKSSPLPPQSGMPSGAAPALGTGVPVMTSQASAASLHGAPTTPASPLSQAGINPLTGLTAMARQLTPAHSGADLVNESARNRSAQPPPLSTTGSGAVSARDGLLRGATPPGSSTLSHALRGGTPRVATTRPAITSAANAPLGSAVTANSSSTGSVGSVVAPVSARPLSRSNPSAARSQSRGLNTRLGSRVVSATPSETTTRGHLAYAPTHRYGST